jgi:hypothetical protein
MMGCDGSANLTATSFAESGAARADLFAGRYLNPCDNAAGLYYP